MGGYVSNFGSAGYDFEMSKMLCSQTAECGGVTRQYDVHAGKLWTLRASRVVSAEQDNYGCTVDTCESWVYLRTESNTSMQCHTQVQELDRVGFARARIDVSDGTHSITVVFSIRVVHAPFRVHSRLTVFASPAGVGSTVKNAVFGLQRLPCVAIPQIAGRSVLAAQMEDGQLRCEAGTANAFRRCHCEKYSSTPQELHVVIENPQLSPNPTIVLDGTSGTLILPAANVSYLSGNTRARITLIDGDDNPYFADTYLHVRPVNQAPSFRFRNVSVRENENCRAQDGWDILDANTSSDALVACRHSIANVSWHLSAGAFPERCLNCGQNIVLCDLSLPASSCVEQSVTFRVFHVSDAAMFQILPHLSLDGVLSFALWPQVSGDVQLSVRLVDDGAYNAEPSRPPDGGTHYFERPCSAERLVPCGPASGAAQYAVNNGTDVSEAAFLTIRILATNQQPSMVMDRQLSCLDVRDLDTCICPSAAAPLQQTSTCRAATNGIPSVTLLENSGQYHLHGFVRQISAGGGVPNQIAVFGFEREGSMSDSSTRTDPPGEGNLAFVEMRADPHEALGGLEAAVDFAISPDGAHAYAAELNSNTLAVLEHGEGDDAIKFLDRRAQGENRVRFLDSETFTTQNPCSAKILEKHNETFLALMQGCEVLIKNEEHLPSYRKGGAYLMDSKLEEYGYLWNHTVGFWKFSSHWMQELYYEPKQAPTDNYPCQTGRSNKHITYINPGKVIDIKGNFEPANMSTDLCRINTYQDTHAGKQPSLLTYLMNDGVTEALNFDGSLMQALWISHDVAQIEHLFPKHQISVEVWFAVESPTHPINAVDLETAGLVSASDGFTGWDLYYTVLGDTLQFDWAVSLVGKVGFGMTTTQIENFQFRKWYHIVASFDGINGNIFVNGTKMHTATICECPEPVETDNGQETPTCNPQAPPQCTLRMPRASDPVKGTFILGAGSKESAAFRPHYGQIISIRVLDVAMSAGEVRAAYNQRKDSLQHKIPEDTHWTKAYGGGLLASPSLLHADATQSINITVMGRFEATRQYSCRWTHNGNFADSAATVGFALALDSTPETPRRMCTQKSDGKCIDPNSDDNGNWIDPYYKNQLTCPTPRWGYGYKAAIFSVVETSFELGVLPLWQRTCVRYDTCGYIDYAGVEGYLKSTSSGEENEQLWYLTGNSRRDTLPITNFFGQNRGDFTFFTFTTNSMLMHLDEKGGFTDRTVPLQSQSVLGASKIEIFKVSGSNHTFMAIANYWDGLSTQTNSIIARLDLASNYDKFIDSTLLLQSIPTQGATGIAHLSLTAPVAQNEASTNKIFDYLAVANYGSNSKIYRWSSSAPIIAIHIAQIGTGYIPGIILILAETGKGFLAYMDTKNITLERVKGAGHAAYNFTGGQIECNPTKEAECARIVSHGTGFAADTSPSSLLAGGDLKCPQSECNPLKKDCNCTSSQVPVCNAVKVEGDVDIYYDNSCARDNSACTQTRMSNTITTMTLMSTQNVQPPGHTSKCFKPGVVFHNNSKQHGSNNLRVEYSVNRSTGAIVALDFADAASHGSLYVMDPQTTLNDSICRCGTTITSLELPYGGQGYSSGLITMSGSATKQSSATGSGFLADFLSKGNVTEIVVLDSGAGFTSPPRVVIGNNDVLNSAGRGGAGAQAVALLKLDAILLLSPGAHYLYPPTVLIEQPQATGGRQAVANAIMQPDLDRSYNLTTGKRYLISHLEVTEPGFGYMRQPKISFLDHPQEDSERTTLYAHKATPTAMGIVKIVSVLVNHDYSLHSVAFRDSAALVLHWKNKETWFGSQRIGGAFPAQNEQYVQIPSGDRKDLKGVSVCSSRFASLLINRCMSATSVSYKQK